MSDKPETGCWLVELWRKTRTISSIISAFRGEEQAMSASHDLEAERSVVRRSLEDVLTEIDVVGARLGDDRTTEGRTIHE
jgi:hypothetical protein